MKISMFYIFIFFITQNLLAQQEIREMLNGKVVVEGNTVGFIKIINLGTETEILTTESGYFNILAKRGDILIFSSSRIKMKQIVLKEADFKSEIFVVFLRELITELEEAIVTKSKINAQSLGIIQKEIVLPTLAERRLASASSSPVEALLNALSGRTGMLKNDLLIEQKKGYLEDLQIMFGEEFYVSRLKISKDYIKAFQYYCIENASFTEIFTKGDKSLITFSLIDMARQFNAIENQYDK